MTAYLLGAFAGFLAFFGLAPARRAMPRPPRPLPRNTRRAPPPFDPTPYYAGALGAAYALFQLVPDGDGDSFRLASHLISAVQAAAWLRGVKLGLPLFVFDREQLASDLRMMRADLGSRSAEAREGLELGLVGVEDRFRELLAKPWAESVRRAA